MATCLRSQLFLARNGLSLALYLGVLSGRWGGTVVRAGDTIQRKDLLIRLGGDGGRRTERRDAAATLCPAVGSGTGSPKRSRESC